VPKANELNRINDRKPRNYLKENFNKAVFEAKPKQAPATNDEEQKAGHRNYGKVPSYLDKYKKQREQVI
jgi:hypothetical protein